MINNENINTNQQLGISILRIVSTFSVILIHVSGPLVVKFGEIPLMDWYIANIFDGLSRYSVPMFFMISGALLLSKDYKLYYFIKKRFGKIIPPFLFWSLIYSLLNRYVFNSEIFRVDKVIRDIFYGSEYHLWFVYALMGIYLITPIIRKWIKNASQNEILYVLIIWLFTLIIGIPGFNNYFPKINLSYFTGFIGYFVLGYFLKQFAGNRQKFAILAIAFGAFITIVGTSYFTLKNSTFYPYFYEYLNLNTLLVALGVFLFFNKINVTNDRLKELLLKLNQCCFGIYLIHPLVLKVFILNGFNLNGLNPAIAIVLIVLLCFLLSFIIIYCLKSLKIGYLMT
ncbi:acyltransferase family protein [Tamlana sp. 2_MG-2023]|uniref:acyltransferase n=1 Tax=unclassified Tamlana TaxID=2614803 RepID=UPI0026E25209|nr:MULTISPECIES: acyltransferase family protein [unclassified Tamlana]MDO6758745.1 acyltransferase family protein [Tamlana sp. 2_MG-2023]MDO6789444.1 acyltransferase family protein [Tamlana sp. 1_MG-2023]